MTLAVNTATVAVIVVMFGAILFAVLFGLSFMRSPRGRGPGAAALAPGSAAPAPISRRDFFRRSLLTSLMVFGAQFGGASLAFLWPNLRGGFGAAVNAGSLAELKAAIQDQNAPQYIGAARAWVEFYGDGYKGVDASNGVDYASQGLVVQGVMALYQKCAHLGCRVPFCQTSQWFECPCHGSKYNKAGEYKLGPAT
jgi:cytochrome b6-f complex iron-sulfur subunit